MPYLDKLLLCLECGTEFFFPASVQETLAEQGEVREPRRCEACEKRHRPKPKPPEAPKPAARSSPPQRPGGGGQRGPVRSYPAVCTSCGAHTDVPFRPAQGRPIFCRKCF